MHVALGLGFLVSAVVTILFALNQGEAVRKQIVATLEKRIAARNRWTPHRAPRRSSWRRQAMTCDSRCMR